MSRMQRWSFMVQIVRWQGWQASFVVGDRPTDIEAAEAAGLPGFLFTGGDLDAFIAGVVAQTKVL